MIRRPPRSTLFPTRRSSDLFNRKYRPIPATLSGSVPTAARSGDRKSTRLNSSHSSISYAVFFFKKKYILHLHRHFLVHVHEKTLVRSKAQSFGVRHLF